MNAREIANRLIDIHRENGWRADREIRFFPRRIDVLAIAPRATEVIGFEIKISMSDFRHDLAVPAKRRAVSNHCTQFYYVTPLNLVKEHQVPDDCGLIYYCEPHHEQPESYFTVALHVPNRESLIWDLQKDRNIRAEQSRAMDLFYEEHRNCDDVCYFDENLELPKWMFPPTIRPYRFQFDPCEAARRLASKPVPEFEFCEVPF